MYILCCSDGSLYVGSTKNLSRRLIQHADGDAAAYTRSRLPITLVYSEEYVRVVDAFRREKQVQNWGRAKRLALIAGDLPAVQALSKKVWKA